MANAPLTEKESTIYKYLKRYIDKNGFAPTYRQIQEEMGYTYIGAVQTFLKQLANKGYIVMNGERRGITLTENSIAEAFSIPLVGSIAAGLPIEAVETSEYIDIPRSMLKPGGSFFALRVKGDSMEDAHIIDGDIVIIKKQKIAENGDTVAAVVDQAATLKKYYHKNNVIELHSANEKYKPIRVKDANDFEILGILAGVIRRA
jgi:repressor LexA